ncbi:DbpA RNA binding domain-containing protein [Cesiribacter andamanensis]|uniref:DbpA RNA binding domain-containing protein n=1 Tax=Cesiribacter andamanensis TaxID=649507 RepID=UPI00058EE955|nr:DbpA RNA binding domain-containing protein [Cesiribacter andamanensis]
MSKTDLLQLIQEETGIRSGRLGKIELFDSHAYLNLGEAEAEKILQVFSKKYGRQNPLFSVAPSDKKSYPSAKKAYKKSDKKRSW